MAEYLPPTDTLPIFDSSVFTDTSTGYLTYDQAKKYFLKYPNAQGDENLQSIVVNGTSLLYDNLTMTSPTPAKRAIRCGYLNLDDTTGAGGSTKLQIYTIGNSIFYSSKIASNFSAMNFQLTDTSDNTSIPLTISPLSSTFNLPLNADYGLTVSNYPSVFNSGLNVYSSSTFSGAVNIAVGYAINISPTASINFSGTSSLNMASALINQSGTATNIMNTISMLANKNITMPAGTGIISQTVTTATDTNILKKTDIRIDSGVGAGAGVLACEVYDTNSGANGRGFFFMPNGGGGSYNGIVQAGDSGILGRNIGANNNAMVISCWTSDKIGLRINGKTVGAPTTELCAGTNSILQSTTQTLFNKAIAFDSLSYASPRIVGQLGYILSASSAAVNIPSSASVQNIGNVSLPSGVWIVEMNFSIAPITSSSNFTYFAHGISTTNSAFESSGSLTASNYDSSNISLGGGKYFTNTSRCSYTNTSTSPITLYFNVKLTYGGASNCSCGGIYTITRIA